MVTPGALPTTTVNGGSPHDLGLAAGGVEPREAAPRPCASWISTHDSGSKRSSTRARAVRARSRRCSGGTRRSADRSGAVSAAGRRGEPRRLGDLDAVAATGGGTGFARRRSRRAGRLRRGRRDARRGLCSPAVVSGRSTRFHVRRSATRRSRRSPPASRSVGEPLARRASEAVCPGARSRCVDGAGVEPALSASSSGLGLGAAAAWRSCASKPRTNVAPAGAS